MNDLNGDMPTSLSDGRTAADALPAGMRKIVVAASLGTMIEYYDFLIYGTMTAVLALKFFPAGNASLSLLLSAAVFGTGYIARPLGSLVFGRMGDTLGRKVTFLITLSLMGVSTTLIGIVPTYQSWGIYAPAAVIVLRLLQGFSLGGEYGGAATYVAEFTTDRRRGFYTGFVQSTATIGFLIALLIVFTTRRSLGQDAFMSWGWRVPFLLSSILVVASIIIRLSIAESPLFVKLRQSGHMSHAPLTETLLRTASWKRIGVALFGATGPNIVSFYATNVYAMIFLQGVLKVDLETATICMLVSLFLSLPFFPLFGAVSDWFGRARLIRWGSILAVITFVPLYMGITAAVVASNWVLVTFLLLLQMLPAAIIAAPTPSLMVEMFPTRTRVTSVALANQIGNVLFAGFLPLIGLTLTAWTGNKYAGLFFPIAVLLICIVANAKYAGKLDDDRLRGAGSFVDNDPDLTR